jgi:GNAT superfamily N-acetyltransferase
MRILEHDELPSDLESDLQLLRLSVGWAPRDFHRIDRARKRGYPAPDYFGLYAIEGKRVVSTVRVLRLPYTFPDGHVETVSGILSVITRRDARGRGLASRLFNEVHARERKVGIRFCLLWTEKSIPAHRLYESMGYGDVYAPEFALKRPREKNVSHGEFELPTAKNEDVVKIERIHAESNRRRIGFTPRPQGYVSSQIELGIARPESFRLILRNGKLVGYIELQEAPNMVKVSEVVIPPDSTIAGSLIPAIEGLSSGRWLTFWNTFVRDSRKTLEGRKYAFSDLGDHLLMSLPLVKSHPEDQVSALGTADPRFVCQVLDYF